ncbi:MAG: hypothetical protein JWM80_4620 [Cyanobacteria bacterium RYN_339]|nr:hypothetical protein [Cyanobacteria bacterium RYN_339]
MLANGIDQLPEAERERIVDRITDIVMAHAGLHQTKPRLEQIPADNRYPLDRTDTSLTSLAVLRKLLTEQLPDVNKALAEPGGKARFESLPIVVAANQRDHKAYKFERGSDYFDFMAVGLIGPLSTRPEAVLAGVSDLEGQAGLPPHFGGSNWLFAAFTGLMESLGTTLFASELVTEQLYEVFKQAKPQ